MLFNSKEQGGMHPFLMAKREGHYFGMFILNSNAQQFKIKIGKDKQNPQSIVTYTSIGGVLDMFFFSGGSYIDVL